MSTIQPHEKALNKSKCRRGASRKRKATERATSALCKGKWPVTLVVRVPFYCRVLDLALCSASEFSYS